MHAMQGRVYFVGSVGVTRNGGFLGEASTIFATSVALRELRQYRSGSDGNGLPGHRHRRRWTLKNCMRDRGRNWQSAGDPASLRAKHQKKVAKEQFARQAIAKQMINAYRLCQNFYHPKCTSAHKRLGNFAVLKSLLEVITPVILTYNEAPNIQRTLAKLNWAKRVFVIDCGSTDSTLEITRATPRTEVIQRPFDNFANQWNFACSQVATPWVLTLDADYVLSDAFIRELGDFPNVTDISGYKARFVYCVERAPATWHALSSSNCLVPKRPSQPS